MRAAIFVALCSFQMVIAKEPMGVIIEQDNAIVSMGVKSDVSIRRTGKSEATVKGNLKTEGIDSSQTVGANGFMLKKRKVSPDECKGGKNAGLFARNMDGEFVVCNGDGWMRLELSPYVKERLDGDLVVTSAMNLPKAQSQRLSKLSAKSATGSDLSFLNGGDLALIIQLKGSKSGAYGKVVIKSVKGTSVTFMDPLTSFSAFGNPASDVIVIQRVPYYKSVSIAAKGTLNVGSWNGKGTQTGILAFQTRKLSIATGGAIRADGDGYAGGISSSYTGRVHSGESYCDGSVTVGGVKAQSGKCGGGGGGDHKSGHYSGGGGGGGHGTAGQIGWHDKGSGRGNGGSAYGGDLKKQIFLGAGGGGGSENRDAKHGRGGRGGGIVIIWSDETLIKGSVSAKGSQGAHLVTAAKDGGGGGAGGSVMITGIAGKGKCKISGGGIDVGGGPRSGGKTGAGESAGGAGGNGRALHPCTFDKTVDGALTVSKSMALPKTPAYKLNSLSATKAVAKSSASGIKAGDTVLILQMKGSKSGAYAKAMVSGVSGSTITFASAIKNVGSFNAKDGLLVIQRLPVYTSVVVNKGAILGGHAWAGDGSKTGVVAFVTKSLLIREGGKIGADGYGYKGGISSSYTGRVHSGESYCTNSNAASGGPKAQTGSCGGGGGGDHHSGRHSGAGGGGGYGAAGSHGKQDTGAGRGYGGKTYGGDLTKQLFLGAGGGGGSENTNAQHGRGGNGGGIIMIWSEKTRLEGVISARGNTGNHVKSGAKDGGGAGAGGSIFVTGGTCTRGSKGSVSVLGGGWSNGGRTSGQSSGGAGGHGRAKMPKGC